MEQILDHLGFDRTFRYEKYRTEFRASQDEAAVVTLDETPIGDFIELEGTADWIDPMATQLGFSSADYILKSYGTLYQDYCAEHGIAPGNMVFSS
jgi:adenylate cyclase class 2